MKGLRKSPVESHGREHGWQLKYYPYMFINRKYRDTHFIYNHIYIIINIYIYSQLIKSYMLLCCHFFLFFSFSEKVKPSNLLRIFENFQLKQPTDIHHQDGCLRCRFLFCFLRTEFQKKGDYILTWLVLSSTPKQIWLICWWFSRENAQPLNALVVSSSPTIRTSQLERPWKLKMDPKNDGFQ